MQNGRYVHIFFLDGVGLGGDDPDVNPFVSANLPHLTELLGAGWFATRDPIRTERASLVPTDANLEMPKKPQSATGQATILTGRNVAQLVGEHYGPKPNPAVQAVIAQGTLFQEVVGAGGQAALITPYPQGYFDAVARGKRLLSAVPLAATQAGLPLMNADGFGVRSQDLPPAYIVNGSFYLISPATLRVESSFVGKKSVPLFTKSPQEALDIDTLWDFKLAEAILHLDGVDVE